ncbi:hypothetical protein ACQKPC_06775 [Pseudomonas sp. NPDC089918]|uniref:hypothetical protein n=1 Tax=Pseudomonas sp. NPDC089918 TaxID=3390654 RepID=UPI003D031080
MIRVDVIWLATERMDIRAGTETVLVRVIAVFGAAKPDCAYGDGANRRLKSESQKHFPLACIEGFTVGGQSQVGSSLATSYSNFFAISA